MNYLHIAERIFNCPLMVHAGKLQLILGILGPRMDVEMPVLTADLAGADFIRTDPHTDALQDGIAVIPVTGTLVNRYASAPSGVMSYDAIRDRVRAAVANEKVRGIMLRVDSFGGEVGGAFDTADVVHEAGKRKPVWASIDDNAYSAAYLLASQAERIYATRTAGMGSVGVMAVHYDFSKYLENKGIKPTLIYAGARKADLYPETALPDEARSQIDQDVNRAYQLFVDYVAHGRGLTDKTVKATEAGVFKGTDGIRAEFADHLGTFEEALKDFAAAVKPAAVAQGGVSANSNHKEAQMSQTADKPAENPITQADLTVARTNAITAERARINQILTCEEAQGREQLARTIAMETDTSAEAAKHLLAAAPVATQKPANPLEKLMADVANPKVGTDSDIEQNSIDAEVKRILALSGQAK